MNAAEPILVRQCADCHSLFLPRPGSCPRCGSRATTPAAVPPEGEVLASVQVDSPPAGFPPPHRLAIVELSGSVRILGRVEGDLPTIGQRAVVRPEGAGYLVTGLGS